MEYLFITGIYPTETRKLQLYDMVVYEYNMASKET